MINLRPLRNILINKYPLFRGCAQCPDTIPWATRREYLPSPDFPIDLVFTWVDGNDPALATKRSQYISAELDLDNAHFRDNDELRFALRSWHTYAPWINHIYIITDNQTPAWLNTHHPKISIIDHTECIPPQYLPTFSSRVIEAHLHNIPNLSEHFIYSNDDFFLLNQCAPKDFFTANGMPYTFTDWRNSRKLGYYSLPRTLHTASYHNVVSWLKDRGVLLEQDIITAHIPYAMNKKNMEQAYLFYFEAVKIFCQDKFRTMRGMVLPCHAVPLLAYAQKRTVPKDIPYYYINSKRFDRKTYYDVMVREKDTGTLPLFLCLNDVGNAPKKHSWQKDLQLFLSVFYSSPSPYEL